jgi:hypothetical protein
MIKNLISLLVCYFLAQTVWADSELTGSQFSELMEMAKTINHRSMAFRGTVMQKMLVEANFTADRLKLPTRYPIRMTDICDNHIASPWSCVLHQGTNRLPDTVYGAQIFDTSIPRESRLRALKIGLYGYIDNANYEFGFESGRLHNVMRLSEPNVEYYAHDLDKLIGKPSLIDTNGAYNLATRWLTAMDIDMAALTKLKWTVNQLHYLPRGATNAVILPLFYVDFGSKYYPASGNQKAFDKPLISVEILGTTKELQDLQIYDSSYSRRPQLLITNAFDLVNTPNQSVEP